MHYVRLLFAYGCIPRNNWQRKLLAGIQLKKRMLSQHPLFLFIAILFFAILFLQ